MKKITLCAAALSAALLLCGCATEYPAEASALNKFRIAVLVNGEPLRLVGIADDIDDGGVRLRCRQIDKAALFQNRIGTDGKLFPNVRF